MERSPFSTGNSHPTPIDFTGVGDPRRFPIKDFQRTLRKVIQRDGTQAWVYGHFDAGYSPLRETITHILGSQGIRAQPQDVLITSGSQQALALVCQLLLKPGDVIVVEEPTYDMALELFRMLGFSIVGVPVDAQGMQVEVLEPLLQNADARIAGWFPGDGGASFCAFGSIQARP